MKVLLCSSKKEEKTVNGGVTWSLLQGNWGVKVVHKMQLEKVTRHNITQNIKIIE